ncbi:hypothetical protein ANHYDRO_01696 [Anaerococcus hydrogenalis DSM 7454]|uniref:Uncharacterized protein n=1 Tax=Anaerococcus hydrogenalis DSM 7454 TaxID=561177 RepID=B6WAI0_9FIRM|nr:hypothetical protein ANHYDRO_01696 [Anaerococcus hydrogenalis DSM 7454]
MAVVNVKHLANQLAKHLVELLTKNVLTQKINKGKPLFFLLNKSILFYYKLRRKNDTPI